MLEQQGLVYHLHLARPWPAPLPPRGPDEPCYLVCERCERVDTVASSDLDDARSAVSGRVGYQATFTHFPVVGLCPACAAAAAAHLPPGPADG
ncbi:MAG: hypothetical protein M3Y17_07185 [Actinomycetota bacterium]|nr:hypothetical protein [Actinomycetota bacterium]